MRQLKDLEIGVMFWAGGDPVETIRQYKKLGATCGQIGIPGELALSGLAEKWKQAAEAEDFPLVTVFAAYKGESYADIPTVQRTVGFIPESTREEREKRTYEVIDFGAAAGIPSFACHIGFVPEDSSDPNYVAVRDLVRRICDYAAKYSMNFALETGQEPAHVLIRFIEDVNRPNLFINFDPANMIMYGTGDPIEALEVVGSKVISVHCKDGKWPAKDVPGALGVEVPLGQGEVGMERFIQKLKEIGYRGPLCIEREIEDQEQRLRDIEAGVKLLQQLVARG